MSILCDAETSIILTRVRYFMDRCQYGYNCGVVSVSYRSDTVMLRNDQENG